MWKEVVTGRGDPPLRAMPKTLHTPYIRGIQLSLESIVGGVSNPNLQLLMIVVGVSNPNFRYPAGKFRVTNFSNNNETRQLNASGPYMH